MYDVLLVLFIIGTYMFIGFQLHEYIIKELQKDSFGNKLYSTVGLSSRIILCIILMLFWLPMIIGEIIYSVFIWIAKYYE